MEEIVALDSSKQKKFVKSIKGIKKLIQKNKDQPKADKGVSEDGKIKKHKRKEKGLVYLAHIPHGFYENEMTQYFKQFGMVTNVRVIRSKRTGNSKGFAFVEFRDPTVAQIVADTMNNYLMGKRLIKAVYIPPEKQRPAMRKKWNSAHNPGSEARLRQKKVHNAQKTDEQELTIARKILGNITEKKQKLKDLGIDYDFFMPVDVPEKLLSEISLTQKKGVVANKKADSDSKKKISKKEITVDKEIKATKKKGKQDKLAVKEEKTPNVIDLNNKNKKEKASINDKQQKQKQKQLKDKGVKPAENFIKVQQESEDDSDSELDFDSDEYEKLMENDDESLSEGEESDDDSGGDGSDDDGSDDDGSDNDSTADDISDEDDDGSDLESEEEVVPKKGKGKNVPLVLNPNKLKKQTNKKENIPQQAKRKAPQAPPHEPKKSKFEKQQKSQPFVKKQFKKKKNK